MIKRKIFIAFDKSKIREIKHITKYLDNKSLNLIPKFGLEFFYSPAGRLFLKKFNRQFWLDLKINDVPNTTEKAIKSLKDLKNIRYLTVHANSGAGSLKAAKKASPNKIKVFGVTILTSIDKQNFQKIGYSKSINEIVKKQADLIYKCGLDGIICSGSEAREIKKKYKKLMVITPGIRLPGDKSNDQKRVNSPREAFFKNNVDGIVIGRSITSGDIKKNIDKLVLHLNR